MRGVCDEAFQRYFLTGANLPSRTAQENVVAGESVLLCRRNLRSSLPQ